MKASSTSPIPRTKCALSPQPLCLACWLYSEFVLALREYWIMKSSEFSFRFMPGLILMRVSRLRLQTSLLSLFPLLLSSNAATFFTKECYQSPLLKQAYGIRHPLQSVSETESRFPAFKAIQVLLLRRVTPSRSIGKPLPHGPVPVQGPAPAGTSCCSKAASAGSRRAERGVTTDTRLHTLQHGHGAERELVQPDLDRGFRQMAASAHQTPPTCGNILLGA